MPPADKLGATDPAHFLMPKHLSRIKYGPDKGKCGYDPTQHQVCWDTAWRSLTSAVHCPACGLLQTPADKCRNEKCNADIKEVKSATEGLRFHDLRHSFITDMVERGVPLGTIQAFVGHMSKRMLDHYTHISTGAARRAVELLDQEPMLSGTSRTVPSVEVLRHLPVRTSNAICGESCGEMESAQSGFLQTIGNNGGDDGTRTRDLCRDRAAL